MCVSHALQCTHTHTHTQHTIHTCTLTRVFVTIHTWKFMYNYVGGKKYLQISVERNTNPHVHMCKSCVCVCAHFYAFVPEQACCVYVHTCCVLCVCACKCAHTQNAHIHYTHIHPPLCTTQEQSMHTWSWMHRHTKLCH